MSDQVMSVNPLSRVTEDDLAKEWTWWQGNQGTIDGFTYVSLLQGHACLVALYAFPLIHKHPSEIFSDRTFGVATKDKNKQTLRSNKPQTASITDTTKIMESMIIVKAFSCKGKMVCL